MRRLLFSSLLALACAAPAGAATTYFVDGRGWGHGIGMSQYGADGYAGAGWGYERILAHYYPTTKLEVLPARRVRVLLAEGKTAVRIGSPKPFRIVDAKGKGRKAKAGTQNFVAARIAAGRFPLRVVPGASPLLLDGKAYRGTLLVHRRAGKLTIVNRLPLDRYLRGVVPWEMPDDWHREALRAQAVVARSYALATMKPGELYDLYADTRSQVYGGVEAEARTTNLAVGSTAGRVLTWRGRVATTFYHSTSGGRTVSIAEAWPRATPVPYLVSVADPYDARSKHHRWGPFRLTPAEVGKKLGVRGLRDVQLVRGPSGRVATVRLKLKGGTRTMLSQDFRRALDLRSTWFSLRVLDLRVRTGRALASAGRPVVLTGFVRGLARPVLQQQVGGGAWRTVARVRPKASGRFSVTVRPKRTASYRLASHGRAGAVVTVRR